MNNMKKIMIILGILIVIIICILIIQKLRERRLSNEAGYTSDVIIGDTLELVNIRSNYYTVRNIVEQYYYSLCNLNKTSKDVLVFEYDEEVENLENDITKEIENTKKRIYSFFDEDYITKTGLSTDNLQKKLGNFNNLYVLIEEMYVRDITENLKVYFVFGNITEKLTMKSGKFQLMIAMDSDNNTYNIYTSDYIEKYNLYELSKEKDFNEKVFKITNIEDRKYNTYEYKIVDDEEYAKDLLKSYVQAIKYENIDYLYGKLDEKYKAEKFKEKSDYENYINANKSNITTATLKYYKDNKYENYRQYICVDQNENYYIFNETSTMNYTLILDNYTIDLPEFIQKYEIATTEEKVMLNIQKIVHALNGKDYSYVYSKLADEFKENYFKNYETFAKYAEYIFDVGNEITFNKYIQTENLCTYEITLKGKNKTVTKTIVMKLEEGTDFVMSFNVK